jgi:CheY-like chemotaxis protein
VAQLLRVSDLRVTFELEGETMKIFIVDPSLQHCTDLEKWFMGEGHQCGFTTLFSEAPSCIAYTQPDVVVYNSTSTIMPHFMQHILVDCNLAKRPFMIAMGSMADKTPVEEGDEWKNVNADKKYRLERALAFEHGADVYDQKPLDPADLRKWLTAAAAKTEGAPS